MDINFEMLFVSCLIQKPILIKDFEVDIQWFSMPSMQVIIQAIQETEGNTVLLTDIQKAIKSIDYFKQVSIEELEMLRDNGANIELAEALLEQVHKDYLINTIAKYSASFAKEKDTKYLRMINELNEELESVQADKDTGHMSKGLDDFIERMKGEVNPFIKTFPSLDRLLGGGITRGSLYTIGARPSVGKSAMALSMAKEIIHRNEGVKIDFFSLEMPLDQIMIRFVANDTKIHATHLRNPRDYPHIMTEDKKKKAIESHKRLQKLPIKFYTSNEMRKLNSIIRTIKKNAVQDKYVAIIDHALLVNAGIKADKRIQILEITQRLKALTNDLKIPIILLTQLNRETDRSKAKPVMADLQESGSFEQDSNVVMMLYRVDVEDRGKLTLDVAKNRDGMVGELPFKLQGQFSHFAEDFDRRTEVD